MDISPPSSSSSSDTDHKTQSSHGSEPILDRETTWYVGHLSINVPTECYHMHRMLRYGIFIWKDQDPELHPVQPGAYSYENIEGVASLFQEPDSFH